MDIPIRDRRQELLAIGPSLLGWASAMTRDPAEAQALVDQTLRLAADLAQQPPDDVSTQAWAHRLLRSAFHSVKRDLDYRRSPNEMSTRLSYARKHAQEARGEAEAKVQLRANGPAQA